MARSSNQKLKLLYIKEYFERFSDQDHPITVPRIISFLESVGITAERKSIYDDIEALRTYGLDIVQERLTSSTVYFLASRQFEIPELKLLVDSVQSSKFITTRKTMELIKKLESLCSEAGAGQLQRQVYVRGRIKTMNESIYYNVDGIHGAISKDRQITFRYFEYSPEKERVFRHKGEKYKVSPFALLWDDDNYYLIAFDSASGMIRHYRVDKMSGISAADDEREGKETFAAVDMARYSDTHFGMFTGKQERVCLKFADHLAGAVIDRFGKDVPMISGEGGCFSVYLDVTVSPQFFGWLCGFGADAEVLSPASVAEQMREHVKKIAEIYDK